MKKIYTIFIRDAWTKRIVDIVKSFSRKKDAIKYCERCNRKAPSYYHVEYDWWVRDLD